MNSKKTAASILSFILCLSLAFVGLLGALEVTLFKEGYLIHKMEKTDYFQTSYDLMHATCQRYTAETGLSVEILDSFINLEWMRTDMEMRVDARFRALPDQAGADRFSGLYTAIEDRLHRETDQLLTEEQAEKYSLLSQSCDQVYRELTAPPFDAALSTVLQYRTLRKWAWAVFLVVGAAAFLVLQKSGKAAARNSLRRALLGAGLSQFLLAVVLAVGMKYKNWMPAENIDYKLFCSWMSGLAPAVACMGLVLVLLFVVALFVGGKRAPQRRPAAAPRSTAVGKTPTPIKRHTQTTKASAKNEKWDI